MFLQFKLRVGKFIQVMAMVHGNVDEWKVHQLIDVSPHLHQTPDELRFCMEEPFTQSDADTVELQHPHILFPDVESLLV